MQQQAPMGEGYKQMQTDGQITVADEPLNHEDCIIFSKLKENLHHLTSSKIATDSS
jgi:hypothetical protein